jgi:hypothetical protein
MIFHKISIKKEGAVFCLGNEFIPKWFVTGVIFLNGVNKYSFDLKN